MTTALQAADRTSIPILEFGRAWMLAPSTSDQADDLGLDGLFGFWVNGRAGVIGDVDSDIAAAAIAIGSPSFVRRYWEHRPDTMSSLDCSVAYAETAAQWGREQLDGIDTARLERLDELTKKVVMAADASVGMLFAGWRALPHPHDLAGRVTVRLNVLRELRGGAHISAIHAVGLGPVGAIVSSDDPVRGGEQGATRFGWTGPFPKPDLVARAEAELITSQIAAVPFRSLDDAERGELADLVDEVHASL
jgi:hypothetical protein